MVQFCLRDPILAFSAELCDFDGQRGAHYSTARGSVTYDRRCFEDASAF